MFHNVTFYRFPKAVADAIRGIATYGALQQELAASPAKPCGAFELQSRGWTSPYGDGSATMHQVVGDCILLALGGEDKILPASVVNDQLRKRIAEIEAQKGGPCLGGRARKRIKEDLIHELLPRALCKPYRLAGYLDLSECFLAVDTSSRKAADGFVSHLRAALGSFPALPLNAEVEPRAVLTGWIVHGSPNGLCLDDSATLKAAASDCGKVTLTQLELTGDEIRTHLEAGMWCTRLGLTLDDRLSFTFGDDLIVRKLKMLDAALDSLNSVEREDLRAELDARFALLSGEVRHLFRTLAGPFRFSTAEG